MWLLHQTSSDSLALVVPSQAVGGMPGESQFNVLAESAELFQILLVPCKGEAGALRSIPGSRAELRRER